MRSDASLSPLRALLKSACGILSLQHLTLLDTPMPTLPIAKLIGKAQVAHVTSDRIP